MSTLTRKSLRQSLQLKACPRCGGDVCRMRDTFGVYHRCAQCGREIRATMKAAAPAQMPAPAASVASIASPAATNIASTPAAAGMPARDSGDSGIATVAAIASAPAAPMPARDSGDASIASIANTAAAVALAADAANMTVPAATIAGIVAATPSHHPAADRTGKLLL